MISDPQTEYSPVPATPLKRQSRIILIVTLVLSLPVLCILFLTLGVEFALKDQLFRDRVDEVFRDGREGWTHFNRTIQATERSVLSFARLVESHTAAPPNESDRADFDRTVQQMTDGTWRSRKEIYSPTREAGIFVPQFVSMQDHLKCFYYRAWQTTTSFKCGALDYPVSDTWVLPSAGGITIFWPDEPDFIFQARPDQDYSSTEWLSLTSPEKNPDRRVRWTSPSFDPVPKVWLISVVAPFNIRGEWGGAVGHDIRLTRFIEYTRLLTSTEGSHIALITPNGYLLLSDFLQEEIDLFNGRLPVNKISNTAYSNLLQAAIKLPRDFQEGDLHTTEIANQIVLVGRSHNPEWIMVNTIPKESITAQLTRPFQWLRLIVLTSWLIMILAVIGIILRDRYKSLTSQQALQESQERLEMALWGGDLGLWDLDIRTGYRVVNTRYAEMLGYTKEEVERTPHFWKERIHPDDQSRAIAAIQANLEGRTDFLQVEYRLRHKNGEWKWIQDSGRVVLHDREGNPLRASGIHQDITERKLAEETLHLREATLAGIFRAAPIIIGVSEGRLITIANDYATKLLGYSPEELFGQDSRMLYSNQEEYDRVGEEIHEQLQNKSVGIIETQWSRKDGTILDISLSFSLLDPSDSSNPTIFTGLDVTERKRIDRDLQKSRETERDFTAKLADLHAVSMELSLCESFDDLCKRAVELGRKRLGYDRMGIWFTTSDPLMIKGSYGTDEKGALRDERSCIVAVGSDWAKLFDERYPLVLSPNHELQDEHNRGVGHGTHAFAGMWDGHRVIGGVAVDNLISGQTITTQECDLLLLFAKTLGHLCTLKRAQEELRESERNLAHAQQIARMGNWMWDIPAGSFTISDQIWKVFGLEPTKNPPNLQALRDAIPPEEMLRLETEVNLALEAESKFETEFQFHTPDGAIHFGHAVADFIRDESGNPLRVLGVVQDTTDRKHAEEERRSLERQIQHTQKLESLGVLAGGIAHDFNNLLMAVLGNADLALNVLPISSPAHVNIVEIEKAARRAADLTRQMLAYSGRGHFLTEEIDLNELVTEMGSLLEASISKRAHLTYHLATGLVAIKADATQIRQVVMNLIVNASEAVGDQEGLIRVSTGLQNISRENHPGFIPDDNLPEGIYVFIEVSDSGCGMDEETRKRIFDPFFTTKFTGRGLGLAAVLGIVRGHKGAIQLQSEKGRGTIFRILLPALDHTVTHEKTERVNTHPIPTEAMVLLVDDEETVRDAGQKMLEYSGFKVLTAENGLEALKILGPPPLEINCILLDLTMPYMDGVETLQRIREIRKNIPVIVMSGYTEYDTLQRFSEVRPEGFIQKPFTLDSLRKTILQVLQPTV